MERNERKRTNRTYTLHQGRCQKCSGVFGHMLVDLMPQHAFSIQARATCAKASSPGCHCICRLVKPSACIIFSLKSYSNISRASSSCREIAELSTSPRRLSLSIKYIFSNSPRPGRRSAYHYPNRSFVKVVTMSVTPPRAILLCDLFDYLVQPLLKSLPLIGAHAMFAFGGMG